MPLTMREVTSENVWESFVRSLSPHALFQSWDWGDVQKRIGSTLMRIGLYRGDELVGALQIVRVSARRGMFLHIRHGPILMDYSAKELRDMLKILIPLAHEHSAWFIRMNPLLKPDDALLTRLKTLGFQNAAIHAMDAEHTLVLDLSLSEEQLLTQMRKTTRYEIKKALQSPDVSIESTKDPMRLAEFFSLYEETAKRKSFVKHTGISEEFAVFGESDHARLFLGTYCGRITAAALVLYYNDTAYYHHGASVHTPISVTHRLQWESIRQAKQRGYRWYNFFGISDIAKKHHPWYGTTVFKRGFGGQEHMYLHAQDLPVHPAYYLTRTIETIRRIKRGY